MRVRGTGAYPLVPALGSAVPSLLSLACPRLLAPLTLSRVGAPVASKDERCWCVAVRGDPSLTDVRCRCDGADRVEASAGGPAEGGANREEAREEARRALTACCLLLDPTVPTHSLASLLRCPNGWQARMHGRAAWQARLQEQDRVMKLGCACCACCSESTIHQEATRNWHARPRVLLCGTLMVCLCGQVLTKHKIEVFKTTLHSGISLSPRHAALGVCVMLTLDALQAYSSLCASCA